MWLRIPDLEPNKHTFLKLSDSQFHLFLTYRSISTSFVTIYHTVSASSPNRDPLTSHPIPYHPILSYPHTSIHAPFQKPKLTNLSFKNSTFTRFPVRSKYLEAISNQDLCSSWECRSRKNFSYIPAPYY